eukprot:scaffold3673_cov74-Phaeocystis_antarctica.AAC.2
MPVGPFPQGAGVLGGSFSGRSPFSAVFRRFRHRPTNPPRSAPRDFERREIRPIDSPCRCTRRLGSVTGHDNYEEQVSGRTRFRG